MQKSSSFGIILVTFLIFSLGFFKFSFAAEHQDMTSAGQLDYLKVTSLVYPQLARQKGWQGTVILKTLVEKDGTCADAAVEKSSGFAVLDQAALNAVKEWEFSPARFGNETYMTLTRVPVRFVLIDKKS